MRAYSLLASLYLGAKAELAMLFAIPGCQSRFKACTCRRPFSRGLARASSAVEEGGERPKVPHEHLVAALAMPLGYAFNEADAVNWIHGAKLNAWLNQSYNHLSLSAPCGGASPGVPRHPL